MTDDRGYGVEHRRLRERLRAVVEAGEAICTRCHRPVLPGQAWHVGHGDFDRSLYRGEVPVEHARCNVGASNRIRARRRRARFWSREWC